MQHPQKTFRPTALLSGCAVLFLSLLFAGCSPNRPVVTPVAGPTGGDMSATGSESLNAALSYQWERGTGNLTEAEVAAVVRPASQMLNSMGFRQEKGATTDLLFLLDARIESFDRAGQYSLDKATGSAEAMRTDNRRTVGSENFDLKGKRVLGDTAARDSALDALATALRDWVRSGFSPDALGLVASNLTVQRPWHQNMPGNRQIANYADTFVREVSAVPGVVRVALIDQNSESRTLTFRIVYEANAFPQGMLNRLSQIEELDITVK